jgi:lipoprotein-anchoring transpeptidase ErfK/SrfK
MAPAAHAQIAVGQGCNARQRPLGNGATAFAVYANAKVAAYGRPGGRRVRTFTRLNANGVSTVFGVRGVIYSSDCAPAWYRVQLPVRPNGTTGFVRADAVMLYAVRTSITVDLSEKRLKFFRGGRLLVSARVGVGTSATPTPTGRYYVNQRLWALERNGPYGPGAIGISAFSPVLTNWAQGGPVGIHGTNDPTSVGRAVSHGCIRVENGLMRRLLRATVTGSPVFIHA